MNRSRPSEAPGLAEEIGLLADLREEQYEELYEDPEEPLADVRRSALRWLVYGGALILLGVLAAGALLPIPGYENISFVLRSGVGPLPDALSSDVATGTISLSEDHAVLRLAVDASRAVRLRAGQSAVLTVDATDLTQSIVAKGVVTGVILESPEAEINQLLVRVRTGEITPGTLVTGARGSLSVLIDERPLAARIAGSSDSE